MIQISSLKFLVCCLIASVAILMLGNHYTFSASHIAVEVFITVICLFVFGSIRYRLDKNALTYGAGLVISTTFYNVWWQNSALRLNYQTDGLIAVTKFFHNHFLTLKGLNALIHADTMLFILGLTFFVSVIAQTRLLESISFSVLKITKGNVFLTIAAIIAVVSFASGILDGVSMIGLTIRVCVMILFLAGTKDKAVTYLVMISTIVTTVCGMWLAYGEPPNLIMKANLHPHLNDAFFLRYCLPGAIGCYLIVVWNLRKNLKGKKVNLNKLDILDVHSDDVRFLQATRHGEVLIATEFVDHHKDVLGESYTEIEKHIHKGDPLGIALAKENIAPEIRKKLLGLFIAENLSEDLDKHYNHVVKGKPEADNSWASRTKSTLKSMQKKRKKAQFFGALAFIPFIGLLIGHAINHDIPLFLASFSGFAIAILGIVSIKKMRKLAIKEAIHEYQEYLFLIPLFLSITLLQKTGFFNQLSQYLHHGTERLGSSHVAYVQFLGATFLSAILDNNVVADFASRSISEIEISTMHIFAMAQIAGYAAGGCWTHIGSAQSVVAYSFITREIDAKFTPFQWMRMISPIIIEIIVFMTILIYGEALLHQYF